MQSADPESSRREVNKSIVRRIYEEGYNGNRVIRSTFTLKKATVMIIGKKISIFSPNLLSPHGI